MECPRCHKITNTNETDNKYFVGRNSDGIPFFKCEQCGGLFYVNEVNGTSHSISRGEKGHRFVPITWGVFCLIIAVGIFWFFGSNIVTWIIGGVFLWLGWSSIKIGIWGSPKLIDEMTLDRGVASSKEATEEWKKINKLE
ncbi:MAG: hypothetical protein A3G31_00435 [Candidatus Schekmanbacteria bacterium RIFCSPLOWO2_12_FULL_38_15]|uniref:Uncharacterized protein n=1 Tax=Candidatus Schekmanbacteria bacterium RIFCSPLOWO2_12_FULL_38_15 TaxID=1817883 RepID=A0A1F7SGI2_9BACT|nr:MAG: hypothetical protein A3G31_00435 [Candidatus Schekmanbacteria bacterium RIFCSPLOWO2_12_FULL_38_15]